MDYADKIDMTQKKLGRSFSRDDRLYFTRLIIIAIFCTACVTLAGVRLLFDKHVALMSNNIKALNEWSKKAVLANEMLEDLFKFQQTKEAYESQGIGATEATKEINLKTNKKGGRK